MAEITARDLANMLGISTAAVSMALNGKPGVSSETRTKVLAAATKLGYVTPKSRQSERQAKNIVSFVIYVGVGVAAIEMRAKGGTHAVGRSLAAEPEAVHQRVERATGHWAVRIPAIRE